MPVTSSQSDRMAPHSHGKKREKAPIFCRRRAPRTTCRAVSLFPSFFFLSPSLRELFPSYSRALSVSFFFRLISERELNSRGPRVRACQPWQKSEIAAPYKTLLSFALPHSRMSLPSSDRPLFLTAPSFSGRTTWYTSIDFFLLLLLEELVHVFPICIF